MATSFPGSFVSPPQREGGKKIIFLWGGETKDPGNEVEKLPPQENYNAAVSRVSPSSDERRRTNARNISLVILPWWEFDSYRLFVIKIFHFHFFTNTEEQFLFKLNCSFALTNSGGDREARTLKRDSKSTPLGNQEKYKISKQISHL